MEKARCNTELYSNLRESLNNVKPSNFLGAHQSDYPYNLIDISISNNREAKSRECIALVENTKEIKQEIHIVQQGVPESVACSSIIFSGGKGANNISVVSFGDWIVESDQYWCHAVKVGTYVNISVDENISGTVRNAKVTVKMDSGELFVISVEQSMPTFNVPKTYTVDFRPSSETILISNIVKWEVSSDASWCSVQNEGNFLRITTLINKGLESRSCNITIDAGYAQYKIQLFQNGITVIDKGYLVNYEIPSVDLLVNSGIVSETKGYGKAYFYETIIPNQRVVTHTVNHNKKILRNYSFLYDYDKRCPVWLAYHQHKSVFPEGGTRTDDYGYDPAIPQDKQQISYGNSYIRGQMLLSSYRTGIEYANRQVFYYTNLPPHHTCFHSGGAVWNALADAEDCIIPYDIRDTLYVVTGTYFDTDYETITNPVGIKCPVPTHFYKCFMLCSFDSDGKIKSACGHGFYIPHHKTPEEKTTNYKQYSKTIDEIEDIIGYDLFSNIPAELQDGAESVNGLDL